IYCLAGVAAKQRLVESLAHRAVMAIVPKLGSWLEPAATAAAASTAPATVMDGPDEQELTTALRRRTARASIAEGPSPYLAGGTPVEERLIASDADKEEALLAVLQLGQRLGLSDEKLRRVEVCADELTLNAIHDAPRAASRTTPLAMSQVRLRFGSDGRSLA